MSDLHIGEARADGAEAAAIAALVADHGSAVEFVGDRVAIGGRARAAQRRHLLLPGLWALHDAVGWISPGGLNSLCEALGVPPAEAYGVATFYDLFHCSPPPDVVVRKCDDLACRTSGGDLTLDVPDGPTVGSGCLGRCDAGSAALVQRRSSSLRVHTPAPTPHSHLDGGPAPRLLRRILEGSPSTLADYQALGGFDALRHARSIGPEATLGLIADSGLWGRGGAAFPTGAKWAAVAASSVDTKHVVANADESEPGTFKDRALLERDPFALVEAMLICGLAIDARHGWIYVRGEYPEAHAALTTAIAQCRAAGLLGTHFDIELRRGAGAYICGEETALLESIEGYRGEPRNKPPYPTTNGLFGHPTVINNVETLVNVVDIVRLGADSWRSIGTSQSPGTRLFCLSGGVRRPGVYERPMGVSLAEVIAASGGVRDGRELQAVLLGGAAGVLVEPDRLDIDLSLEGARAAGVTLGSGVVMVFDDSVDMRDVVRRAGAFFAHESCGQCVPCRVGTRRQLDQLESAAPDAAILDDLDRVMTDASICGLGQTAASLVRSARNAGWI